MTQNGDPTNIAPALNSLRVPLGDLTLDQANARKHDARNLAAIGDSLTRFGQRLPVVVQKQGMVVRAGNGRVEAARALGWSEVAAVVVDESNVDATAYALVDNRTAELAEWDDETLRATLAALEADEAIPAGWTDDELAEIFGSADENLGDVEEDQVPEVPDEPTAKRGQLWELGRHRVLCGDSTKAEDVARLGMGSASIVADPPYGMRLDADFSGMVNKLEFAQAKGIKSGRKYDNVIGDDTDFDASAVLRHASPTEQFWFGADYYASTLPDAEHGGAWLVWDKRLDESADRMFGSCFELVWSSRKCKRDMLRHKWAGIFGTEKEPQRGRQHPNQKPVVLLADILDRFEGDVYDPFLGSGTTLIAAEQLGRTCYGIEIEPRYVDVIIQRWENLTGETAVLAGAGAAEELLA